MADEPPGMIGTPPSARGPIDPADQAVRVAREWEDVAEAHVRKRMRDLGVPEGWIGVRRRELARIFHLLIVA